MMRIQRAGAGLRGRVIRGAPIFLSLLVLLMISAAGQAQTLADYDYEHLSFRGVGLDYGHIRPSKVEPTSSYNLRIDLGYLGPNVRIVPTFTYWSSRMRQGELARLADQLTRLGASVDGSDLGPIEWRNLSLSVDGQYIVPITSEFKTFVGTGLALHVFNGSGPVINGTFIKDLLDTVTAGVAALAGAEFAPQPWLRIYTELRYALVSDVRYPGVRVGAAFALPTIATGGAR